MYPIPTNFYESKQPTTTVVPVVCYTYDFFNGSGATKVATGTNCDGSPYLQIVTLGRSFQACLREGTQGSSPSGLTITQGSSC